MFLTGNLYRAEHSCAAWARRSHCRCASMSPAAKAALTLPPGLGFIYVPHGADLNTWTPEKSGVDFELSPTLKSLEPFRKETTVITNLKRAGTVVEMHAGASSGWLSGAIPKRTEGEDFGVGETIDQVLANKSARTRRSPPLNSPPRTSPAMWAVARPVTVAPT